VALTPASRQAFVSSCVDMFINGKLVDTDTANKDAIVKEDL